MPDHPGGSRPAEPITVHGRTAPDTASPAADPATDPGAPVPAPEVVYLVAGGDMVAVFADRTSADVQDHVMVGANLDTTRSRLTWARWVEVRAELRTRHPEIEIIDVSGGPS
ncbi:hypothetical protein [Micromonospora aurantiaca (nom. illeg.)]|uniref:hypothetical protein n=1 Tax=Micromonospora aurantiaca (nom. illeg.) TaxID=47850 RepID=UPI0033FDE915